MVEDIAKIIARNARKIRRERNLTLRELAIRSGVSISMISKIENSQTLPSVATYVKIASALGVSFGELVTETDKDTDIVIVRASERPVITRGPYTGSPLAYKKGKKKMEPFIFDYPVTKRFPKHRHENEEMIFVIKGAIEFKYGEKIMVLRKGDCCYFNGAVIHGGRSLNRGGATAIVVQSNR